MIRKKNKTHDFQKFKTRRSFRREFYDDKHALEDVLEEQIKFKNEIDKFKESRKPKTLNKKEKKLLIFENAHRLLKRK